MQRPVRKKKPPASLAADNDWEQVPTAVKNGLVEASTTKSTRASTTKTTTRHRPMGYANRFHDPEQLPEVDHSTPQVHAAIASSENCALDWLYKASNDTVELYRMWVKLESASAKAVSYTHLTLPTIYSV